jgi:enterochelin esterase-like enzyme
MSSSQESFPFGSDARALERTITVYLPSGYDPARPDPYPLLVLHDGQNLFDPDRAHVPGEHWRVGETADRLMAEGRLPPLVIAGIDHAGEARIRELTPTRGDRSSGGGAARYGRFVMEDLVPHLARTYHVQTASGRLAMGGASLGGLVTLAIARQYPGRFGRLLVMSPSVWWDGRVILRRLRAARLAPPPRIWLDIGRREGARAVGDTRMLNAILAHQSSALHYREDPEGDHSERAWSRRLPAALEWLYRE